MAIETTYTAARTNFARLCNAVAEDREVVFIRRRNAEDVALIAADELKSLMETAHLLRSPRNAERLEAVFQPEFSEDLRHWVDTDRKLAPRCLDLVEAIVREPFRRFRLGIRKLG